MVEAGDGASLEDRGSTPSGMEVEEVARLERKVQHLERAESTAMERVRQMGEERKVGSLGSDWEELVKEREKRRCD